MSDRVPRVINIQAPVLIVPHALDLQFCARLIKVWEDGGNEESYTMIEDASGSLRKVYDRSVKIRRDHFLGEGEVLEGLKQRIRGKVCPAVRLAFRFEISRFEDFRIGCYDSDRQGFFGPHRDDATEGTAHRLFALSVNLNADEYEGGYLCFPDFGTDCYKPGTGDAVVFSGGLLHQVTPVATGRRFALLSFLYGERESAARKDYYRRMAGAAVTGFEMEETAPHSSYP